MNNQLNNYFKLERKKHFEFFLPFYKEKNWQVIKDNIDSGCKNDWDVRLEIFAGEYVLVDEKVRDGEFNDFLLEIIQDMKTGNLGWFFGKKDWILYASWQNIEQIYPSSLYKIKVAQLKEYIYILKGDIKTRTSPKGWGITWNIVLGWENLINRGIAEELL